MPRTARAIVAVFCYHVINRANNKARVFHDDSDYAAFVGLIAAAQARVSVPRLAACLMPNHIHLVVQPSCDGDVARWMHWLFTNHVGAYHHHLLTVMRYVERNALRAKILRDSSPLATAMVTSEILRTGG